jgi:curved DNA-binding protein CbpA
VFVFVYIKIVINYYTILCVTEDCHSEDIRRSYYALARRYHPDNKETGDVKRMALINKAYEILMDPERRTKHDHDLKKARQRAFLKGHKYIAQRFKL